MDPIISPWTIFWLQALINLDKFNHWAFCFIMIANIIWIVDFILVRGTINGYDSYIEVNPEFTTADKKTQEELYISAKKEMDFLNKIKTPLIVLTIFSILCIIFIPSKEMLVAMIASSYVTPDNISAANEAFKANLNDYVNIITDAIKK